MLMARRTPARINRRATIGPVQVITTWGISIIHTYILYKQVDIGMLCVSGKHGKGRYVCCKSSFLTRPPCFRMLLAPPPPLAL